MANLPEKPTVAARLDQRLKEVHQSDLTEGRINQDFVDWLKTKGMSYLLVLLLVLCGYLLWVRWHGSKQTYQATAWQELATAALPTSLEEVAAKYDDVGAVSELARINAGSQLLRAVQLGKTLGADEASRMPLTPEQRTEYLDRADRIYTEVLAGDDQSTGKTLLMVTALTGRAAVAESRGEIEAARELYKQAAARSEESYPELAAQSRKRAENVAVADPKPLPTLADVQALQPSAPKPGTPPNVEGWIRELVDDTSEAASPLASPAAIDVGG
jgi:hypothetical protein